MKYSTYKQIKRIKIKIINILLFPIICLHPLIDKIKDRLKKHKKYYSQKQIREIVQFLIDYWTDEHEVFYIFIDTPNIFDCSNIKSPFEMYFDMSCNIRIRNKISNIFHNQREEYYNAFRSILSSPMTEIEKKKDFKLSYECIKDGIIYKINNE